MALVHITQDFQYKVQKAMANAYRFERCERFAMREVLKAWDEHSPAEKVFVDIAHAALAAPRRPLPLAPVRNQSRVSVAA